MTPLDNIHSTFSFLTADYGFELIETRQQNNYIGNYLAIYRNNNAKLQLEICADNSWFHCEIRRLLNGQPAKYSDKDNCIGFESLAILESNHNYDHFDYFAGGRTGLHGVLKNTAKLFQRHKSFFTTDCWVDTNKIEQLEDSDFEKKFGSIPDREKPSYIDQVKKQATDLLIDKGFQVILDNSKLAPFDRKSMTQAIIFDKEDMTIKISAEDWRDAYYIFYIAVNGQKIFEIDFSKFQDKGKPVEQTDIDKAVLQTIDKLKQLTEKTTAKSALPKAGRTWWQKLFGSE